MLITLQSSGEERHVSLLVAGDLLQVVIERAGKTSLLEVLRAEGGQTQTVEVVLEVLQGKSIVEDVGISDAGTLLNWDSGSQSGEEGNEGGPHVD